MSRRQSQRCHPLLAAFQHTVKGGQILAVLDGMFCALENLFHRIICQRFKPKFLDLFQLLGIGVRRVVLVVVIEPEQREDLVDGLDVGIAGARVRPLSRPRMCP